MHAPPAHDKCGQLGVRLVHGPQLPSRQAIGQPCTNRCVTQSATHDSSLAVWIFADANSCCASAAGSRSQPHYMHVSRSGDSTQPVAARLRRSRPPDSRRQRPCQRGTRCSPQQRRQRRSPTPMQRPRYSQLSAYSRHSGCGTSRTPRRRLATLLPPPAALQSSRTGLRLSPMVLRWGSVAVSPSGGAAQSNVGPDHAAVL